MADPAPAGAPANPQASIDKYAAKTQEGAAADEAIVHRVEGQIANSPMGWLQGLLGEAGSKADSEREQAQDKVDEMKDEVAKNEKDAPPDAGTPPKPGTATKPAVPAANAPKGGGDAAPAKKGGGEGKGKTPGKAGGKPATKGGAAPAGGAAGGDMIATLAGGDGDISKALDAYEPKSPGTKDTIAKIKQMGDVAQGFQGQIDTYIGSAGDGLNGALARAGNWIGEGKNIAAVWSNNPYKKAEGFLGSLMKVLSAIKSIAGIVGSICGKIGMILTVVGLLGMIFPPIGAAVSAVARILNIVGLICDVISFALSGVLTGLNGVRLAQLVAAGASPEEKAACADQMMSEANDAASGLISLAMQFGPKFMKGLFGKSKGILNGLMKRAKAMLGKIAAKISGNVKNFADKLFRKLGFGGVKGRLVDGVWQAEKGAMSKAKDFVADKAKKAGSWAAGTKPAQFVKKTATAIAESKPGKFVKDTGTKVADWAKDKGTKISSWTKDKVAKINDSSFMKKLDERAAKMNNFADKIDMEKGVENLGKKAGSVGENWKVTKTLEKGTQSIEDQTKAMQKKFAEENLQNLAESREAWMKKQQQKQLAISDKKLTEGSNLPDWDSPEAKKKWMEAKAANDEARALKNEAGQVGAVTKAEAKTAQDAADKTASESAKTASQSEALDEKMLEKRKQDPAAFAEDAQKARIKRRELEGSLGGAETKRKELQAIAEKDLTPEQTKELADLNKQLKPLEELRKQDDGYYKALSGGADRPTGPSGGVMEQAKWYKETGDKVVKGGRAASDLWNAGGAAIDAVQGEDVSFNGAGSQWAGPGGSLAWTQKKKHSWDSAEEFDFKNPLAWDKDGAKEAASKRAEEKGKKMGGAPALEAPADNSKQEFHDFVVNKATPTSIAANVKSMLSGLKKKDPAAAPAPAPAAAPKGDSAPAQPQQTAQPQQNTPPAAPQVDNPPPAATPAAPQAATPAAPQAATPAAPQGASPAATPDATPAAPQAADPAAASGGGGDAGGDAGGGDDGEALPYWPHLLAPDGEFTMAMKDFAFMRKIAIEFKKGQVSAKQKAVDTLATYGKYDEYAAKRKAEAQTHKADTQAAGQVTQQNQAAAGDGAQQAGKANDEQNKGKDQAGQKAAVDIPEPESSGFWGRIIGRIKRWAKSKAMAVMGWIQEKIADVILRGLCGVSMADMKAYSGALKNQQARAKGVADTGAETSDKAGAKADEVKSTSEKETGEAEKSIAEADTNIQEADTFLQDINGFEQQLKAESTQANQFISQITAEVQKKREEKKAADEKAKADAAAAAAAQQQMQGATADTDGDGQPDQSVPAPAADASSSDGGTPDAASPDASTADPAAAASPDEAGHDTASDDADEAANAALIKDAANYAAGAADTGVSQVEGKAEDYKNQIKAATTNRDKKMAQAMATGSADIGDGATAIVAELKTEVGEAKQQLADIEGGSDAAAEAVVAIAKTLDDHIKHANEALDKAFLSLYEKIKASAKTTGAAVMDKVNDVAAPVNDAATSFLDNNEGKADAVYNAGADVVGAVANPIGDGMTSAAAWGVDKMARVPGVAVAGAQAYGQAQVDAGPYGVPMMPY